MACARVLVALSAAVATLTLGSCAEYLERRDTLLLGAGDAVQTNIVMQVIDPWPAHAQRYEPYTEGSRTQRALERYRNPPVSAGDQAGLGTASAGAASAGAATGLSSGQR